MNVNTSEFRYIRVVTFVRMAAFANVVGMVVSIRRDNADTNSNDKFSDGRKANSFGKLFYDFPAEKDTEACYEVKMLMLDG